MSRTVDVPAVPVTLLKVVEAKVCEVKEDGKALVAYNSSKNLTRVSKVSKLSLVYLTSSTSL